MKECQVKLDVTKEIGEKNNVPQFACSSAQSKENLNGFLPGGCAMDSTEHIHQDKVA